MPYISSKVGIWYGDAPRSVQHDAGVGSVRFALKQLSVRDLKAAWRNPTRVCPIPNTLCPDDDEHKGETVIHARSGPSPSCCRPLRPSAVGDAGLRLFDQESRA